MIPLYNEVGFDEKSSDTHLLMYTRVIASEWACKLGNRDCIQKANGYFNKWMRSENAEKYENQLFQFKFDNSLLQNQSGSTNNW